jgi:hypothetical protein
MADSRRKQMQMGMAVFTPADGAHQFHAGLRVEHEVLAAAHIGNHSVKIGVWGVL